MKTDTPIADSRLELRISANDKRYVNRAAELQGEAVSSFARSVLVNEARRIVESEQPLCHEQMGRGRNRQKLGQTLQNAQKRGLNGWWHERRALGSRLWASGKSGMPQA